MTEHDSSAWGGRGRVASLLLAIACASGGAAIDDGGGNGTLGCDAGTHGCPCYGNGSCNDGLVCDPEVQRCVADACTPGANGCPCVDGTCLGDLACTIDELCGPHDTSSSTATTDGEATTNDIEHASSEATGTSTTGDVDDPDLLLWQRFDGLANQVLVNDGALGGVATCVPNCPALDGGLARFDGVDECLALPSDPALASDNGTVALWMRRDEAVDAFYYELVGKAFGDGGLNSWEIYVLAGNQPVPSLRFGTSSGTVVTAPMPMSLAWVHVAATWDGARLELWVDGTSAGATESPGIAFDDHPVQVACDDNGTTLDGYLGGSIDDVRVYARVLDPTEIALLAQEMPK